MIKLTFETPITDPGMKMELPVAESVVLKIAK